MTKDERTQLRQRRQFEEFVTSLGVQPNSATALHKTMWLGSFVDPQIGLRLNSIEYMAGSIKSVGCATRAEAEGQHQLVRTFLRTLRTNRRVKPPKNPSPVMLLPLFRRVLALLDPSDFYALRRRLMFLLIWWTGLGVTPLARLTRRSIEAVDGVLRLRWRRANARSFHTIDVPQAQKPDFDVGHTLELWYSLSGIPDAPDAFVFPSTAYPRSVISWFQPMENASGFFNQALRQALVKIDQDRGYDITSLRRAHALLCRKHLGPALAQQRMGLVEERSFQQLLRAEPDWDRLPKSLLD